MDIVQQTPTGLEQACDALRRGKLVVWPSPLWYGLSASAFDTEAVRRLYRAKRRNPQKALLVLIQGMEDAERYGHLNPVARQLVEVFWPGYLGIIVEKKAVVSDTITAGRPTVLLACLPDLGHALPCGVDGPVVASSANRAGMPPALDMHDVRVFVQQQMSQLRL